MRNDRGSLSVMVVALTTALFVLLGLVVDGGRALAARQTAWDVAAEAARLGASQVSVQSLRWNEVGADPVAAENAASGYFGARGYRGSVSVLDDEVSVTVTTSIPTTILGLVGIDQFNVSASANAIEVHGVTRAD